MNCSVIAKSLEKDEINALESLVGKPIAEITLVEAANHITEYLFDYNDGNKRVIREDQGYDDTQLYLLIVRSVLIRKIPMPHPMTKQAKEEGWSIR